MIEGDIEQEQVFRHIRTGDNYVVLNGTTYTKEPGSEERQEVLMKMGEHGPREGWTAAVVYYPEGDPSKTFVRDEKTFCEKFERV